MRMSWPQCIGLFLVGPGFFLNLGCSGSATGDDDSTEAGDDDSTKVGDDDSTEAGDDDATGFRLPELEESWRATGLTWPESARYDASRDVIYVSHSGNGGGIATLDTDGSLLEAEWATGLSGARGVGVHGDRVYVATDVGLAEIDANDGTVLTTYSVPNMGMPNDVAVDSSGTVYLSDTVTHAIYRLAGGTFEVWVQDQALEGPNGICVEDNRLVIASLGMITDFETFAADPAKVHTVSLVDKSIGDLTTDPVGNLDGIDRDENGNYFVTDWQSGTILYVTTSGEVDTVLNLAQGNADLSYLPDMKMLLVPSSLAGEVVAFKVK